MRQSDTRRPSHVMLEIYQGLAVTENSENALVPKLFVAEYCIGSNCTAIVMQVMLEKS